MPHLARLSRFCRGRPRRCSRRLSARLAVVTLFAIKLFRFQASTRMYVCHFLILLNWAPLARSWPLWRSRSPPFRLVNPSPPLFFFRVVRFAFFRLISTKNVVLEKECSTVCFNFFFVPTRFALFCKKCQFTPFLFLFLEVDYVRKYIESPKQHTQLGPAQLSSAQPSAAAQRGAVLCRAVPCRAVLSISYISREVWTYIPGTYLVQVHACGVRVVFVVPGALGICKSPVCT